MEIVVQWNLSVTTTTILKSITFDLLVGKITKSWLGKALRITGSLWWKSIGRRWIPLTSMDYPYKDVVMRSVDNFFLSLAQEAMLLFTGIYSDALQWGHVTFILYAVPLFL